MITLRKFNTLPEAATLIEMLQKAEIEYSILKEKPDEDSVFAGNTFNEQLLVQIKEEDREASEKIMDDIEEIAIDKLEKDYYLFTFSDDELLDILKNPDEWGLNDYHWSFQILESRGIAPSLEQMNSWKKSRYAELEKPIAATDKYITLSYLACLLGGIIGVWMGHHLTRFDKIMPDGKKVLAYDEPSRNKGKKITQTGYIFLILWIVAIIVLVSI